jgi:hypothetical protein
MPLSILFLFFRNFLWITTSITLFECYLLALSGNPQVIMVLLWTKLAADGVIGLLFLLLHGHKMYFYYNLGYSKVYLLAGALAIDLLLWTISMVLTSTLS